MSSAATAPTRPLVGLLLRTKLRGIVNRVYHAVDEAPVRLSAAAMLVGLVWFGLYQLFRGVFVQINNTPLEATVALPLVFNFFFLAMLIMLTMSNAIIAYSALFNRAEAVYLLTAPLTPRDVVTLKYLESLALSSWSLVLLGLPLMLAMADQAGEPGFYALFIAFFLAFIPIPGAVGLVLAWLAARFVPRKAVRWAVAGCVVIGLSLILVAVRSMQFGHTGAEMWLREFFRRMSFVESVFLPNNWVAQGIDHALYGQLYESLMYLLVTFANALFLSWLAVLTVSTRFDRAYDRASAGGVSGRRVAAPASGGPAGLAFCYLTPPLRLVAAKDLRTFLRDPLQWSQLAILFGLLALYLTNMPTLRLEFGQTNWFLAIPFLNLCAVSLILATFTCRFVFPLVSLEGQKLWLMGVLPMERGRILLAKFAFSMTVTSVVAVGAMGLAAIMLKLALVWTCIHLVVTIAICFGLCGFAVGLGARMPSFDQPNAARIANGVGGTVNLLASVALVAVTLGGVGVATYHSTLSTSRRLPDVGTILLCGAAAALSVTSGLLALRYGARHFARAEI